MNVTLMESVYFKNANRTNVIQKILKNVYLFANQLRKVIYTYTFNKF